MEEHREMLKRLDARNRQRTEDTINHLLRLDVAASDIAYVKHQTLEDNYSTLLVLFDYDDNAIDSINVTGNSIHATLTEFYRYMAKGEKCFGLCRKERP